MMIAAWIILGFQTCLQVATSIQSTSRVEFIDTEGDRVLLQREGNCVRLFGNDELVEECLHAFTTRSDGRTVDLASADGEVLATTFVPAGEEKDVLQAFEAVFRDMPQPTVDSSALGSVVDERQLEGSPLITWQYAEEPMSNLEIANQQLQSETKAKVTTTMRRVGPIGSTEFINPAIFKAETSAADAPQIPPVLALNQVTFAANVLRSSGSADTYMVLFCYSWWEACQQLAPAFDQMATSWQDELNKQSVFTQQVRFAQVDCALERVLCNEQGVEGLPHVQRYSDGIRTSKWIGGRKNHEAGLAKWLDKQLTDGASMQSTTGSQKASLQVYYALIVVVVTSALACFCIAS